MNLVQKYGGCYLKNMDDLKRIAAYVAKHRSRVDGLVLVCASMHEIAAEMMDRAKQFAHDITEPEMDALFSAAELQTAALMASALESYGVHAHVITDIRGDSLDLVQKEEGKHEIVADDIISALEDGKVAVVAGFQGIGEFCMSDRLGRYGAAATAVSIAAALGCECELYGNAQGVYVVDPKVTGSTAVFRRICHEEAMELVMLGESDLEAEAIEISKENNVPLYVGPAFDENSTGGTYIVDRSLIVEEAAVSGISVSDEIVIFTIKGISRQGDAVAEIFATLGDLGVNIDVISQQTCSSEQTAVSFSCSARDIPAIEQSFKSNARFCNLDMNYQDHLCLVSVVGVGMATHVGVAGTVFKTLAENEIRHYNITTSEISISTAIDIADQTRAVIALSEAFSL